MIETSHQADHRHQRVLNRLRAPGLVLVVVLAACNKNPSSTSAPTIAASAGSSMGRSPAPFSSPASDPSLPAASDVVGPSASAASRP